MERALAIILAGGRGSRMGAFCRNTAKPALPFAGPARVIDFPLSNCVNSLITDIAVLTDYQRESMGTYLEQWADSQTGDTGLYIIEPPNGSYSGTADAVFQNTEFLKNHPADKVLVLAGDHIYRMNYQNMLAYHRQTGADATIAVMPVPLEEAHRFGVVTVEGRIRVTDFVEKPAEPSGRLVSMGIYVFSKHILLRRLREDAANPGSSHDFGHDVLPLMIRKDKVAAYRFSRYWKDIGTPGAYYESNMDFLPGSSRRDSDMTRDLMTGVKRDMPSHVHGRAVNSVISPGCVIKGRVENSVLAPGVRVEEGAVVRDSVLMTGSSVGEGSLVDGCLIGEDVRVEKFCILGSRGAAAGKTGNLARPGDRATAPRPTVIGSGSTVLPDRVSGNCIVIRKDSRVTSSGEKEELAHAGNGLRTS